MKSHHTLREQDTAVARAMVQLLLVWLVIACVAALPARAGDKKEKEKAAPLQAIDSGSFGIFVKGQRVATESFTIHQQNATSTIQSELKEEHGPATQKSDLEITSTGQILHYEWTQGPAGSLTVMPNNEFLIEKIMLTGFTKPAEQSFLMPNTSVILDNNFFVHREVLAWRYLASDCKQDGGAFQCQRVPGDFGVLVPQDRTSLHIRMELVGAEKVNIRGSERELLRLNLKGDNVDWALWVDDHDQFKLMKVAIPADNTEVVRD